MHAYPYKEMVKLGITTEPDLETVAAVKVESHRVELTMTTDQAASLICELAAALQGAIRNSVTIRGKGE